MLFINNKFIGKAESSTNKLNELIICQKKGDIFEIISKSTEYTIENMISWMKNIYKNVEEDIDYLIYGNAKGNTLKNLRQINKGLKSNDNVIYIPKGIDQDKMKEKLSLELEKNLGKSDVIGYSKAMIPFIVAVIIDVITVPTLIESLVGLLISLDKIKQRNDNKKLRQTIKDIDILQLEIEEYLQQIKNVRPDLDIDKDSYYEIDIFFDVLVDIILEKTNDNKKLKHKDSFKKAIVGFYSESFKDGIFNQSINDLSKKYLSIEEFVGKIKEVNLEFPMDIMFTSFTDGEKRAKELIESDDLQKILEEKLSQTNYLPGLNWNLFLQTNMSKNNYDSFMKMLDYITTLRFAYFLTDKLVNFLDYLKIYTKNLKLKKN